MVSKLDTSVLLQEPLVEDTADASAASAPFMVNRVDTPLLIQQPLVEDTSVPLV